jgi:hypothetical protein
MAQAWQAKAPGETVERRWQVPLADGDGILTVSATGSSVTVDSDDYCLDEAVIVLSAGSAGDVGAVTVTVATSDGNTHVETFVIPIRATTVQVVTARDVCGFALRKIVGNGVDPDATELTDALELLGGILSRHGIGPIPLSATSEIDVPDDYLLPLKFMLRKLVHSTYEAALSPVDLQMADEGERWITNSMFEPRDLAMPSSLSGPYTAGAL